MTDKLILVVKDLISHKHEEGKYRFSARPRLKKR